ncbi:MAG: hypothetical protein N2749_00030 [Clostridia bacterium]|nr:hypothetical protein [Clostridia bacterium]
MNIGIIEVGSTNSKGYIYGDNKLNEIPFVNIEFKKNYKANGKIVQEDKKKIFEYIIKIRELSDKVYVYGTSIFRDLDETSRSNFIDEVKEVTGAQFEVVSSERENEYTVFGAISGINYEGNIAVMIGGGGSTEISICNNSKILEVANSNFGVFDTFEKFSDLNDSYATSNRDELVDFIKTNLKKPKLKADILILAGGDFILCYTSAKYPLEKNNIYFDKKQPYIIQAQERADYDLHYYYDINLDDMRKYTPDNPNWWNGSRAMCSFAKSVADMVQAKYIIPTKINMIYGIIESLKSSNNID